VQAGAPRGRLMGAAPSSAEVPGSTASVPDIRPSHLLRTRSPLGALIHASSEHTHCTSASGAVLAALHIKGGGGRPSRGHLAASSLRRPRAPSSSASFVDLWCALCPLSPPYIYWCLSGAIACSADPLHFTLSARKYGRYPTLAAIWTSSSARFGADSVPH
jgi:hypothetical protein